jgi:hypothetical protein
MKKLIISLAVIGVVLLLGVNFAISKIQVDVESADLPQDVYQNNGDLLLIAQGKLIEIVNPLSTEDEYTLTEEFLNYMILDSIRENINSEYDPLGDDCEDVSCSVIYESGQGNIEYLFVKLNDDNQIVVTMNFNREQLPAFETALFVTFDVEVSIIDMEIRLVLDTVFLNDIEITKDQLDMVIDNLDKDQIEQSISMGELDLDTYTYSVSLLP